jgi:hypothetical protein
VAVAIGILIGLAGMMTFKAIFYAPCFAGLAWLKGRESPAKIQYVGKLMLLVVAAMATFGAIYFYYAPDAVQATNTAYSTSAASFYLRWLSEGIPFAAYSAKEIVLAPVFFLCLALAPLAWRQAGLKPDAKIALAGFILPLAVVFFYRNTFPYFFVFILAPVAVAIAPVFGLVRERVGSATVAVALSVIPLATAALEPRDMIRRQRALIDYVHREFPEKTGYLDYSGMIADYPRILSHLTSGNGIQGYYERGDAIVAKEINRGNVPFIIANQAVISGALQGAPIPKTLLPDDVAALRGNYVRQWGVLWREGQHIPAGVEPFEFRLSREKVLVLAGSAVTIDGVTLTPGTSIRLAEGHHLVGGRRNAPSTLWRDRLPTPPPDVTIDRVFTNF